MSAALVVLWVGTAASLGAHQPDLDGWAAARELRIEEAAPGLVLPPAGHDDALADRVESLLALARTEAFSASPSGAAAALDDAQKLLEGAPGLPENAFLMAEVYRQRGVLTAETDPVLARELDARAVALAGPRAAPFAAARVAPPGSEKAAVPAPPSVPTPSAVPRVPLDGPLPGDEVTVDGVEVHDAPTLPDGTHHVRILRTGRLAWAGWVTAHGTGARAPVPRDAVCSETDLRPREGYTVECDRYAVARPAGRDRIEVAMCHGSSCGEFVPWSRSWGATFELPVHSPRPAPKSRSWILWTAAGVAATAVGALVLVEAGVFEHRAPPRDTFSFVPPK